MHTCARRARCAEGLTELDRPSLSKRQFVTRSPLLKRARRLLRHDRAVRHRGRDCTPVLLLLADRVHLQVGQAALWCPRTPVLEGRRASPRGHPRLLVPHRRLVPPPRQLDRHPHLAKTSLVHPQDPTQLARRPRRPSVVSYAERITALSPAPHSTAKFSISYSTRLPRQPDHTSKLRNFTTKVGTESLRSEVPGIGRHRLRQKPPRHRYPHLALKPLCLT